MLNKIFFTSLFLINTIIFASNSTVDSLINRIFQTPNDTNLVNLYLEISSKLYRSNSDTAFYYDNLALDLAIEIKDTTKQLYAYSNIGNYYFYKGEYDKALEIYKKGLNIAVKFNTFSEIANYNGNIGNLYYMQGNYTEAEKHYKTCLNIRKQQNFTDKISNSYLQLGNLNYEQGRYENALKYYKDAVIASKENSDSISIADSYQNIGNVLSDMGNDLKALENYIFSSELYEKIGATQRLAYSNYNIGVIYSQLNNLKKAEKYLNEALNVFVSSKNYRGESYALTSLSKIAILNNDYDNAIKKLKRATAINIEMHYDDALAKCFIKFGEIYTYKKDWGNAKRNYNKALEIQQRIGDQDGVVNSLCKLAEVNNELKNYSEALQLAQNVLLKIKELNLKKEESAAYLQISRAYEGLNKPTQALNFYKLYKTVDDSIFAKEKHKQIIEIETKYQTTQKEKQIELLTRDNKIKDLELNEKRVKYSIITGVLLFIILIVVLIFLYYRIKLKKAKVELEQKLLRSQMNPHFIFNSLANIQTFIFNNQNDKAMRYLSSFSTLTRSILENSRKEYVSLEEEIETLNLYLELQEIRFENKFDYKIDIDEKIDSQDFFIPPMLAQPFIENAIQHGLLNKKEKGHIRIAFTLKDKSILFKVEDDGIGREKSKEFVEKVHQSLATQITKERLKNLNKGIIKKIKLEISDLYDDMKQVTGTSVTFLIPYKI